MDLKNIIAKAKEKAKTYYETTYKDICNIYISKKINKNGLTKTEKTILYQNEPCLLVLKNEIYPVEQEVYGSNKMKRFIMVSPKLNIPSNSEVEVIQNNITYNFKNTNSIKLQTHQLIVVNNEKDIS